MAEPLGPQLEREGSRVALGPGAFERFEMRLQRKRRIRKVGAYIVALSICVLGVVFVVLALQGEMKPGPEPATSPTPPPVKTSAVLRPGVYWTQPLTRHQLVATLRASGFGAPREVEQFFKDLGPFSHTVRFGIQAQKNGIWNQLQKLDNGRGVISWVGAYRATGSHEITAFGYGCAIRYGISHRAGQVVIQVVNEQGPSYQGMCGRRDLVAQTVIYDTAGFSRRS